MTRKPETLEEYQVYSTLIEYGYDWEKIRFSTWKSNRPEKTISVEVARNQEINAQAQLEIKRIYPKSFSHFDDDKSYRRHYLILKP